MLYRRSDAIVAYGDHVESYLVEHAGIPSEKIFVAGQAVERGRFAAVRNGDPRPPTVLYVGQLKAVKGVETLITAFKRLEDPRAALRIVGSGVLEQELIRMAEGDRRITFVGELSQDQLPDEVARARCLVLPSISAEHGREPWGLVVNEAMHGGVPTVVSDAVGAGAGGLVVDGRNGIVFPERDERSLTAALRLLISDGALAAELGRQAASDVERFSYSAMADAFIAACRYARGIQARPTQQ